jgi:FAD synthetase
MLSCRRQSCIDRGDRVKRVVATGTFDLLHPGHLYYLHESRAYGDELHVIVARDANVRHKPKPVNPELQRLRMVSALKPVDHARLGDPIDMFRPIWEIRPAVITIGYDQHFSEEDLRKELLGRGLEIDVVRIGQYKEDGCCSSRMIVERILKRQESGDPTPRT